MVSQSPWRHRRSRQLRSITGREAHRRADAGCEAGRPTDPEPRDVDAQLLQRSTTAYRFRRTMTSPFATSDLLGRSRALVQQSGVARLARSKWQNQLTLG